MQTHIYQGGTEAKLQSMAKRELASINVCATMFVCVRPCLWVCVRKAKAKTMAHQIETDFTLYLLAPACDNRLDRKSNGKLRDKERRRGGWRSRRRKQIANMLLLWRCVCV